jgi:hypothetical protein
MGNKIILIAPVYFNYHKLITENLQKKGYLVDFLEDKNSGLLYTLSTKSKYLLKKHNTSYEKEVLSKLNNGSYDLMIVIGGKTLDVEFWKYVNNNYSFKKILYQWDSYKNFDYRAMIPFFDLVKTFDSLDAKELKIPYLALFYNKDTNLSVTEDIDLLFIGIWHSDRIAILEKIAEYADKDNLKYCFKVYYPRYMYFYLVYIKRFLPPSKLFVFKTIPFDLMSDYYKRAKCIVDINHPHQSGLTMRTIETIGRGKKLITTNSFIKQEPFYNDKMIQVIDRDNIILDDLFFKTTQQYEHIEKLEISNWIDELLK